MRRSLEAVLLGLVMALQVLLFTRLRATAYDYDEGTYLLSLDAFRSGQQLGTDIFVAQPPVFYWLLRGIAAVMGDQPERIRLGIAALSALGAIGAWAVARAVAGPIAGLLAAALIAISPPVPLYGIRVLSDLPSLWIGLATLGLATAARGRLRTPAALASGVVATLAVGTKVSALVVVPILVVVLLRSDRPRQALAWAAVGAASATAALVALHVHALGELWASVVRYHHLARATPAVIDRWASIGDLFNPRTPVFWVVAAGVVVFALRVVRQRPSLAEAALWGWAVVAFAFLAWHAPLHYNHLVFLPIPLALAAGVSLGAGTSALTGTVRHAAIAGLVVVLAAGYAQQWRRVSLAMESQSPAEVWAASRLERASTRDDLVATDLPVAGVTAHRLVPGELIDSAYLRFETGSLTPGRVLEVVDRRCVVAVVAGRSFSRQPAIMRGLRARFARQASALGVTVFSRRRGSCPGPPVS